MWTNTLDVCSTLSFANSVFQAPPPPPQWSSWDGFGLLLSLSDGARTHTLKGEVLGRAPGGIARTCPCSSLSPSLSCCWVHVVGLGVPMPLCWNGHVPWWLLQRHPFEPPGKVGRVPSFPWTQSLPTSYRPSHSDLLTVNWGLTWALWASLPSFCFEVLWGPWVKEIHFKKRSGFFF